MTSWHGADANLKSKFTAALLTYEEKPNREAFILNVKCKDRARNLRELLNFDLYSQKHCQHMKSQTGRRSKLFLFLAMMVKLVSNDKTALTAGIAVNELLIKIFSCWWDVNQSSWAVNEFC